MSTRLDKAIEIIAERSIGKKAPSSKTSTFSETQLSKVAKLMSKAFEEFQDYGDPDDPDTYPSDRNLRPDEAYSLLNSPSDYFNPEGFESSPHLRPGRFDEDEHKRQRGNVVKIGPGGEVSVEDEVGNEFYDIWKNVSLDSSDEDMSDELSEAEKIDLEAGRGSFDKGMGAFEEEDEEDEKAFNDFESGKEAFEKSCRILKSAKH